MDFKVSGATQLHELAKTLRGMENKGLGREMGRALTKAVEPLGKAVTESMGAASPSGYKGPLTSSLRHRRNLRSTRTEASVRVTTTAKGEREARDIVRFNAGELRHPVFGRARRTKRGLKKNPWSATRVPAKSYERGTEGTADEAEKQLWAVLDEFSQKITGG
jgi:hypothetical protein